jgi:hypothetical protein
MSQTRPADHADRYPLRGRPFRHWQSNSWLRAVMLSEPTQAAEPEEIPDLDFHQFGKALSSRMPDGRCR